MLRPADRAMRMVVAELPTKYLGFFGVKADIRSIKVTPAAIIEHLNESRPGQVLGFR